jgi:Spy/CpxP family protein refolding chaperone
MVRKHVANFLVASSLGLGLMPIAMTSAAFAQPMPGSMGRGGHHPMMQLRALGLTEAQRDQVFKIFHEQMPAMHAQMKQVRRSREELRKLASSERFDEARAHQVADVQAKAIAAMAVMRAQTMYRIREILTPEQRTRMDQMREHRGGRMPR